MTAGGLLPRSLPSTSISVLCLVQLLLAAPRDSLLVSGGFGVVP